MKNLILSVTVVSSLSVAGCNSSSGSSRPSDSGVDSTTSEAGEDAGEVVSEGGALEAGAEGGVVPCSDAGTVYSRLGGHTGLRETVDAIVQKELGDPDIATYFYNQVATPVPAGHPTVDQIEECITDLLGGAIGGTETYPPDGGVTSDAGTFQCRDLMASHQPLQISGGTFDEFVSIAAGELAMLGVCSGDIATIGAALQGTRSAIVYAPLADAGERSFPGVDAGRADGGDAGATDAGGQ